MNRPEGMAGTLATVRVVVGFQRTAEHIRLISCYGITHPPELAAQRMTNPAANDVQYADTAEAEIESLKKKLSYIHQLTKGDEDEKPKQPDDDIPF